MTLNEQHRAHLARFKIPAAMLEAAGVQSVSDSDARELMGLNGDYRGENLSGIYFPYRSPQDGHRTGARVRLDTPLGSQKYLSEQGCTHLFFSPTGADTLQDVSIPVIIVEAEKSALALAALASRVRQDWLVIATGGCDGWKRKRGKQLTPDGSTEPFTGPSLDFGLINWTVRPVIICFDSNSSTNPAVRRAQREFAKLMEGFGADVRIAVIPQREGVNGPDDFLSTFGDEATLKVLDAAPLAEIEIRAGALPDATDEAEQALLANAERFEVFQRSGELTRVIMLPEQRNSHGLKRPAGTVQLQPLSRDALREILERICRFVRFEMDRKDNLVAVTVNCPSQIPSYYTARKQWRLPVLTGIISAPILRLDGSVLSRPGYDSETGLYMYTLTEWPEIPKAPTRDDAEAAIVRLTKPFAQFPFIDEASQGVHMAAILTGIQRRLLPACPLFAYSAPVMRSGKSMLAESVGIIATGKPPCATTASREPDELRKGLLAALHEGHGIVNFDNVEHVFQSEDLARAITQTEYADRILGETRILRLPTNVLWLATGNNFAVKGDLTARTLLCRIDAECEKPEERTFEIPDLSAYLHEHRPELVTAGLTLLRAFHVAGRPQQDFPRWGGFDEWSNLIRAALVWAGAQDPCETRGMVADEDTDVDEADGLLKALQVTFDGRFTVHEVIAKAMEREPALHGLGALSAPELAAAVMAVASDKGRISTHLLGWWFRKWRDRIVEGRRLRKKTNMNGAKWEVVTV